MTEQRLPHVGYDDGTWGDIIRAFLAKEHVNTDADFAGNGGHQNITITGGTTSKAPITFTAGTNLTAAADGAMEYDGWYYYLTSKPSSTAYRRRVAVYDETGGATGDMYYRDTNGYLTRIPFGASNGYILSIVSGAPAWTNSLSLNTTGTAANLSGTPALPNGTTATTQSAGDNSTKLATTAYVDTKIYVPTAVKSSSYTAVVNDFVPVDATSGGITITLPSAPADKSRIGIKKIDASANAVTISRGGTDVFEKAGGATTLSLTAQNQSVELQYTSSSGVWYVLSNYDTGAGDTSTNISSSVANQITVFADTTGKKLTNATGLSGIAKLTSGVLSAVTAPTGAIVGDTDVQALTNKTIDTASSNTIKINGNVLSAIAGTATIMIPDSATTLAGLAIAQTWTAAQSFNSGNLKLNGATSGTITLNAAATAGSNTITLPAATDMLVGQNTADTLTNKILTSPTLTTPNLGTPSAINLTNATAASLPLTALAASTSTAIGVGSIELGNVNDTTLSRSSAGVLAVEGVVVPRKFTANIGDGSTTSWAVTHNLGTKDVTWSIRDHTTGEFIDCDVTSTSTTVTTFVFQTAPASGAYDVVIIG